MKLFNMLNPGAYAPSISSLFRLIVSRRQLLWEMGKRDIRDRYAGQVLGVFWALLNPLLTMTVYLFIFAFVFRLHTTATQGWGGSYALYLLSGLLPWIAFQEVMNRSITAITGNTDLVKQIIFPLEILPLKILFSALLTQSVALTIFLSYGFLRFGPPSIMILLLPLLFFIQALASAGVALLLSAIAPFFRDIKDLVGQLCFVLIYAMPVFYMRDMLPPKVYRLLLINPFSHMIECYRDALYWGTFRSPWSWLVFPAFAVVLFAVGCRTFNVLKTYFGNVL
jgi:lipopolysaccharide transport system permease protein